MNKALVVVGIAIVALSKAILLKSILIDAPAYGRCLDEAPAQVCGTDPFVYFVIAWSVTAAGAILLIFGLKASEVRISR
jgi:hypothetical protein